MNDELKAKAKAKAEKGTQITQRYKIAAVRAKNITLLKPNENLNSPRWFGGINFVLFPLIEGARGRNKQT